MIFRNLRSGHVINVTNASTIKLMEASDIYAAVESADAEATAKPKKTSRKRSTAEADVATE